MKYYKLVDKKPVKCTVEDFGYWASINERRVAFTKLNDVNVSTVFLGLDHQFGSGEPILFETCIFGGDRDQEITRYHTFQEALKGHEEIVKSLTESIGLRLCPNLHCSGCKPYGEQEYPVTEKINDKRNCRRIHLRK